MRAYKSEDSRIICENFIRLPSKRYSYSTDIIQISSNKKPIFPRTHPDYYATIKQPIDLIRIQQKLRTDEYQTFEQFIDDIDLLLANAKIFYKVNFHLPFEIYISSLIEKF